MSKKNEGEKKASGLKEEGKGKGGGSNRRSGPRIPPEVPRNHHLVLVQRKGLGTSFKVFKTLTEAREYVLAQTAERAVITQIRSTFAAG